MSIDDIKVGDKVASKYKYVVYNRKDPKNPYIFETSEKGDVKRVDAQLSNTGMIDLEYKTDDFTFRISLFAEDVDIATHETKPTAIER